MNEHNLTLDDTYVIIKLVTGEQLLAVKRSENERSLTIEFPMIIKTYPFRAGDDEIGEQVAASPYCKFSDDKIFTFNRRDIIFEKKLNQFAIPFYLKLVNEYETTIEMPEPKDIEDLENKVQQLMDSLKSIAEEEKVEDQQEEPKIVLPSNKTVH